MAHPFRIEIATQDDIPRLAEIHVESCGPDPAISLYFKTRAEFHGLVVAMLKGQIGNGKWTHMKAVDVDTGSIAAWASWNRNVYQAEEQHQPAGRDAGDTLLNREGRVEFKFPPGLSSYVKKETNAFFRKWAGDRLHFYFMALFTHPDFQRRGMAHALVQACNDHADREQLPVVLQASPTGFPVYAAKGFGVIGQLDVDLRDWAYKARDNDKGYGNYTYRFMLREPQSP